MAVGTASALLIAGGAFAASSSVMAGNAQSKAIKNQSEFNAKVYEQQAEVIREQKKIQDYQFNRQAASARGTIVAKTAGKGFLLSGSPLAILADVESQLLFDKAIGDYNLKVNENAATSGALQTRLTGNADARLAKFSGYSNAFSQLLSTGSSVATLNMKMPTGPSGTKAGKL